MVWDVQTGIGEVIVESDAQYVQDAVRVSEPDDSVVGDVIAAVKLILDQHPSYRVVWVNPNANIVEKPYLKR